MSIISRLIGAGDMLLYHDYRSGSFRDFSGNNNHGTPTGVRLGRSGVKCLSSSDLITVSDNAGLRVTSVTLAFVFGNTIENHTARKELIAKRDGGGTNYDIQINQGGTANRIVWYDGGASRVINATFAGSRGIILACNNGEVADCYVNGLFAANSTTAITVASDDADLIIGNLYSGNYTFDQVPIAAVVILDRKVTATEAAELHTELISKKWNQKTISHSVIGNSGLPLDGDVKASYSLPGVTDLTGNGYNGTIVGSPRKGKKSIGGYLDILDDVGNYVSMPLTIWPGTTGALEFITKCYSNSGNARLFGFNATGNQEMRAYSTSDGLFAFYYWGNGATRSTSSTPEFTYGNVHHVVCQWEYDGSTNTTYKLFVNGVEVDSDVWADPHPAPDIDAQLGWWQGSSYDGEIYEFAVHTATRTEAQWAARMKQFFAKEAISLGNGALETVSNVTSGPLPGTPFEVQSGTFKTTYDTINGKPVKCIECVGAGILYSPWSRFQNNENEAAYGTWEFWVNKAAASVMNIDIVAAANNALTAGDYLFEYDASENLALVEQGTGDVISGGTATDSTWHSVKVTRTAGGNFELIVNGTSEGTGSDTTTTIAKYMTMDIDAGDKIAIAGFDGTPLLLKRKGVA